MRAIQWRWGVLLAATVATSVTGCAPEREPLPVEKAAPASPSTAPTAPEAWVRPLPPSRIAMPLPETMPEEGPSSRDPFHSYAGTSAPPPPTDGRARKSRRYSVDELKLVGLVTRTGSPRAMLVDPTGRGHVVQQGELLGKAELVHGEGEDRLVSWRVDRIRGKDVVLVRDDGTNSGLPQPTRVMALQSESTLDLEGD